MDTATSSVRLNDCRLLIAWPDDPASIESVVETNRLLRRVVVIHGPEEKPSLCGNPMVRHLAVQSEDDPAPALQSVLGEDFVYLAEGKVRVILDPGRRRMHPELCRAIESGVLSHVRSALSLVALRALRGWHMLLNVWLNLPRAVTESTIEDLRNRCLDQPAVLVGAGPSLDENVSILAGYHAKAIIVACDGAWSTLANAGIVPDIVVSVDDSERVWRHCEGLGSRQANVPIVCLLQSAWPVARYHRGPLFWGRTGKMADRLIARETCAFPFFDTGQCVGHAALEAAAVLGVNRIIMAGFDLSFDGPRGHPKRHAVPYYDDQPPTAAQRTIVGGSDGVPRPTDWTLLMYLREFERRISRLNIPVFNATARGARIAGTTVTDLSSALSSLPDLRKPVFRCRSAPPEAVHRCRSFMETWRTSFVRLSEQIAKGLAAEEPAARSGPDPFPFLRQCRSAVDVLTEIEHAAVFAEFRMAWEDWMRNGASANQEERRVMKLARAALELIGHDSGLFAALLLPWSREVGFDGRLSARRALAIAGTDRPACGWSSFLDRWTAMGWEVHTWSGKADDAAGIWEHIHRNSISIVLSVDGSVFPAIWAVPLCGCVDMKLRPPAGAPLREAWLPGYVVMAADPLIADAWRRTVGKDRPVILYRSAGMEQSARGSFHEVVDFIRRELTGRAWHEQC